MSAVTVMEKRRRALIGALRSARRAMTSRELVEALEARDQGGLLPRHGRADRVHDALVSLERQGAVERAKGRPARWTLR